MYQPDERLSPSAQRVQDALAAHGLALSVRELPASTRTAVEAAAAVNCAVGQIVKALVFRKKQSGGPLLVLASGANRVDEGRVAKEVGEAIERSNPEFVRQHTGYAIGGVPPLGHTTPIPTLIDEDLLLHDPLWAAAGTPHAVFPVQPMDLVRITGGRVVCVREKARE